MVIRGKRKTEGWMRSGMLRQIGVRAGVGERENELAGGGLSKRFQRVGVEGEVD